jgi:hypothetical protein
LTDSSLQHAPITINIIGQSLNTLQEKLDAQKLSVTFLKTLNY